MKVPILETLKNGLDVLRKNPIIFLPVFIGVALNFCTSYLMTVTAPVEFESTAAMMDFLPLLIATFALYTLPSYFFDAMAIRMAYDTKRKRRISLAKVAKFVAYNYVILLTAGVFFWTTILLGFMLLVIPGIFLAVRLIFYKYAVLLDEGGIVSSLEKSWKVTKGNWWRIAAIMLVFAGMFLAIGATEFLLPEGLLFVSDLLVLLFIKPWFLSSFTVAYLRLRKK